MKKERKGLVGKEKEEKGEAGGEPKKREAVAL